MQGRELLPQRYRQVAAGLRTATYRRAGEDFPGPFALAFSGNV